MYKKSKLLLFVSVSIMAGALLALVACATPTPETIIKEVVKEVVVEKEVPKEVIKEVIVTKEVEVIKEVQVAAPSAGARELNPADTTPYVRSVSYTHLTLPTKA